jgi:hypothetical protein
MSILLHTFLFFANYCSFFILLIAISRNSFSKSQEKSSKKSSDSTILTILCSINTLFLSIKFLTKSLKASVCLNSNNPIFSN